MTTNIKNSEICINTEKILIQLGWCKKTHRTDKGEVCLIEALYYASRGKDLGEVFQALLEITSSSNLEKWNDQQARTKTEVFVALGKATKKFQKEEKQ